MSAPRAGKGNDCASSCDRVALAARQAAPQLDRDDRSRPTPGPNHFSPTYDCAGPHVWCPELGAVGPRRGRGAHGRFLGGGSRCRRSAAAAPGAGCPSTGARNAFSSSDRIHPSPVGVCAGVSDPASASNAARPRWGCDARPLRERVRCRRREHMEVPARSRLGRRPDRPPAVARPRSSAGAIPTNQHTSGGRA